MSETATETQELVLYAAAQNAVQIFSEGGLSAVLADIKSKVRKAAAELDISTVEGREGIASLAYKVSRAKTTLDAEGKKLTEEWRDKTTKVNTERKVAIEELDALKEEVRAPLTAFENKEKDRVAAHEAALKQLSSALNPLQPGGGLDNATAAVLEDLFLAYNDLHSDRDWEEFAKRAKDVREAANAIFVMRISARQKWEADQAELARLKAEETARKAAEAERARIAAAEAERQRIEEEKAAAAEAARLEAERKAADAAEAERTRVDREAAAERERAAKVLREAEAKAARERQEAADRQAEADRRAREAEDARIAAEKKAEADRIAAAERLEAQQQEAARKARQASERARKDREAALQAERDRITRENVEAELERQRKAADDANRARIHAEIVVDVQAIDGYASACEFADLIMAGKVRNVRVEW